MAVWGAVEEPWNGTRNVCFFRWRQKRPACVWKRERLTGGCWIGWSP